MMGYQGWFICQGDGSPPNDWRHWFSSQTVPSAANLTVDMWPDMTEFGSNELYDTLMTYTNGSTAQLYSAYNEETVVRHFKWMSNYGVDGVYLQRYVNELGDINFYNLRNKVASNCRAGADQYGRMFSIMYDITGSSEANMVDRITNDWIYLTEFHGVTNTASYLRFNGMPVVVVWGLGFTDRPGTVSIAQDIIDFFKNNPDPDRRCYLIGGVPTGWRTLTSDSKTATGWSNIYRQFDVVSPWSVGRFSSETGADTFRTTYIEPDLVDCTANGIEYMPVVWPGFSWHNKHPDPINQIPRDGGHYIWHQMYNVLDAGCKTFYVAMFDEVDEATAMYKIAPTTGDVPVEGEFVALDIDGYSLPSDWYLQVAREAGKMIKGTIAITPTMPLDTGPKTGNIPGMRLCWKFDEGSGTTAEDSSGNSFDGTLVNGPVWATGIYDGALDFDGNNDAVTRTGFSLNASNKITVCAWVNMDMVTSTVNRFITIAPEIVVLRHDGNGNLHFYIKTSGTLRHIWANGVLFPGEWMHVAGTWDGTTQRLYTNGVEVGSQVPGGTLDYGSVTGIEVSSAFSPINGRIDDVRVYENALTPAMLGLVINNDESVDRPVVSGAPLDLVTNQSFTVSLQVDQNWGYWSTNGTYWTVFDTNGASIVIDTTTSLFYFGSNSGGVSATNQGTYTIDTVSPSIPGNAEPDGLVYTNGSSITFSWDPSADTGTGIAYYLLSINSVDYYLTNNFFTTNLNEISNSWTLLAVDLADNPSGVLVNNTIIIDTNDPGIPVFTSPLSNENFSSNQPALSWSAPSDNFGIQYFEIDLDGTVFAVTNLNYTSSTPLSAGTHTIRIRAVDLAGNAGSWCAAIPFSMTVHSPVSAEWDSLKVIPSVVAGGEGLLIVGIPQKTGIECFNINGDLVGTVTENEMVPYLISGEKFFYTELGPEWTPGKGLYFFRVGDEVLYFLVR